MDHIIAKIIKSIVSLFANLNGASFVGIKGYTSTTTKEVANHVVNANFSYGNAVEKDLKALQNATDDDIKAISVWKGFSVELVKIAIAKLIDSFVKNQNPETQSNQSKGQQDAFIPVTNSIKYHIASGKLHIFALAVSKEILIEGEYKTVNSKELTLCQNAVKKYFNFTTAKYRSFIVDPVQLSGVNISNEKYSLL
jgi:hypothetical protein